jgi:hypothetical protein
MEKTKIATLITIVAISTIAIIGVAYAQHMNSQASGANGSYGQVPQANGSVQGYNDLYGYSDYHHSGYYNDGHYQYPEQGSHSYGTTQGGYPFQHGMGMSGFHR